MKSFFYWLGKLGSFQIRFGIAKCFWKILTVSKSLLGLRGLWRIDLVDWRAGKGWFGPKMLAEALILPNFFLKLEVTMDLMNDSRRWVVVLKGTCSYSWPSPRFLSQTGGQQIIRIRVRFIIENILRDVVWF